MQSKRRSLAEGLPRRFEDPKTGFKQLRRVLGIANRKEWESIRRRDSVKATWERLKPKLRGLPSSQCRTRFITAYYGMPDERRRVWKQHYDSGGADGQLHIPSLEYQAFAAYAPDFFDRESEDEELAEALAGIAEKTCFGAYPAPQRPALGVWIALRRDLLRWGSLSAEQRQAVEIATFAVATVLDDARFLDWAVTKAQSLAQEFASFLDGLSEAESAKRHPGADGDESDPDPYTAVLREWNQAAARSIEVATELQADPPPPERLDDLLRHVASLESLRGRLVAALSARRRAQRIRGVTDALDYCAQEFCAPWLAEIRTQVGALWQLAYPSEADTLGADAERLVAAVKRATQIWRKAEDVRMRRGAELAELLQNRGAGLAAQLNATDREEQLHQRIAQAIGRANQRKRDVLAVLGPAGHQFDLARNYCQDLAQVDEQEEAGADARLASAAADGAGADSVPPGARTALPDPEPPPAPAAAEVPSPEEVPDASDWDRWLAQVGDPTNLAAVPAWDPTLDAVSRLSNPFPEPSVFASSLADKLHRGIIPQASEALRVLAQFLASDSGQARQDWTEIYSTILSQALQEDLEEEVTHELAFRMIRLLLQTHPETGDYRALVEAAQQVTDLSPRGRNVRCALQLADLFLSHRSADEEHLGYFLSTIRYLTSGGVRLCAEQKRIVSKAKERLEQSGLDAPEDAIEARNERLAAYLHDKSILIYSLQRQVTAIVKGKLEALEPSVEVRLLDHKVWRDDLAEPVRNADVCLTVKSAATHAVTEMIARVRKEAGRELRVPPRKGVRSLLREVYRAAGIVDPAWVPVTAPTSSAG